MNTRLREDGDIEILPEATDRQSVDLRNAHEREEWQASLRGLRTIVYAALLMVCAAVCATAGFLWAIFGGLK